MLYSLTPAESLIWKSFARRLLKHKQLNFLDPRYVEEQYIGQRGKF